MTDPTEGIRRELQASINTNAAERAALEEQHGQVWSTEELREGFTVQAFMAPLVVVTRKEDGVEGTLFFQHNPRFYFGWQSGEEG